MSNTESKFGNGDVSKGCCDYYEKGNGYVFTECNKGKNAGILGSNFGT